MPYANIVYAKLEKRLLNDPRYYMMSELAQLNYVKLILFACETYNKIPKNMTALRKGFKTDQDEKTIEATIKEIKINFPKFKENKHFYYFDEFQTKTNYIQTKELPRNSQVVPKVVTDKEEDKEEDKENIVNDFDSLWETYPIKEGKKEALRHYQASIKAGDKHADIKQALENYINKLKVDGTKPPYIKHGKTFFNNWKDYLHYKVKPKIISRTDL